VAPHVSRSNAAAVVRTITVVCKCRLDSASAWWRPPCTVPLLLCHAEFTSQRPSQTLSVGEACVQHRVRSAIFRQRTHWSDDCTVVDGI